MGGTTALCGTALIKYLNSTDIKEKVFQQQINIFFFTVISALHH